MFDQFPEGCRAEVAPGDPLHGVDVSQASGSVLQVGFEIRCGVVEATVPLPLLEASGLEELRPGPDGVGTGAFEHVGEEWSGTRDQAGLHQARREDRVAAGIRLALLHAAHAVGDGEPDVPDQGNEALHPLFVFGRQGGRSENQQIDVGEGVQFASPVAAHRHEADTPLRVQAATGPHFNQDRVDVSGQVGHQFGGALSRRMTRPK